MTERRPLDIGIAIALFEDVEELDAVGPWDVLTYWAKHFPEDGVRVWTVARQREIRCAKGMTILADHTLDESPAADVLLHPGGAGTRPLMRDEDWLTWVREQRARASLMTSVCTGALVYAAAGLLRGRPATTYWAALDTLREADPTVEVRPDERFVDDGDVITSSGVSAGIDMALHLVLRLAGRERARWVRRGIQYDPEPPV
ncbi:DJ-1/PfpI family protein [Streptoalloteichus hindustanus]|uniref:DJ-1/PfpI family protein n=1 Tax=Streptoalloteichus hindustanus TaxID=2017 RepID=A0A1M5JGS7_STRHI|nr:DJ-1/PfpI family protein [Streptoalloteichus hindustanus]SHG39469.1 DJ-1/PfpI family protein [Streptoalloteichus hindustanus]